jgi:hypothetical protein
MTEKKLCYNFMHRRCNKKDCRYLHDNTICFYHWKDNSCNYGSKCRKRHLESYDVETESEKLHEDVSIILLDSNPKIEKITSRDLIIIRDMFNDIDDSDIEELKNNEKDSIFQRITQRICGVFKMVPLLVKCKTDNFTCEQECNSLNPIHVKPNFEAIVCFGGGGKIFVQNKETQTRFSIRYIKDWIYGFSKDIGTLWEKHYENYDNAIIIIVSGFVEDLEEIPMVIS